MLNNMRELENQIFSLLVAIVLFITISTGTVPAQTNYPAILRIPVTLYDFHSDQSNPEFEIFPTNDAVITGMVAPTLDADMKPLTGTTPFFNRMISRWFRPWKPGNRQIYNYYGESGQRDDSRFDRYKTLSPGLTTTSYDTSFKNIIFIDTLEFNYVSGSKGMYEFQSDNFFPLDNRGFGAEGRSHNYSFTMELHWTFTMVPGLTFHFSGDDDVWAFVNKKLVMDLGGIHNPQYGQFNVDNITGLTAQRQYSFDLFYAERHVTGSNIRITTNIMTPSSLVQIYDNPAPPGNGNLPVTSMTNIQPATPVTVYGHVFDTAGVWLQEFDHLIDWRVEASGKVDLRTATGATTTCIVDKSLAGSQFLLIALFKNPNDITQQPSEARVIIHVASLPQMPDIPNTVPGAREQTAVIPNPFVPGRVDITTVLPASVVENYMAVLEAAKSTYVTFAIVEAPESLMVIRNNSADPRFDSYADVQLYDAVGNLVRTDLDLIAGVRNLTYAVAWNGMNKNKRIVGTGAYLMTIRGKKKNGLPYIVSHKIAVVNRRTK